MNEKTKELIKELDGKMIYIDNISTIVRELSLTIIIEFKHNGKSVKLLFENAHDVRMNFDNFISVECFEVIDNSPKGWEKCRKYLIHDVESDSLSFCCESIELIHDAFEE